MSISKHCHIDLHEVVTLDRVKIDFCITHKSASSANVKALIGYVMGQWTKDQLRTI